MREHYGVPVARNVFFLLILSSLSSPAPCSIISQGGSEIREEENSERKPSRACDAHYIFPPYLILPDLTGSLFYQFHREAVRSGRKKTVREHYTAPCLRRVEQRAEIGRRHHPGDDIKPPRSSFGAGRLSGHSPGRCGAWLPISPSRRGSRRVPPRYAAAASRAGSRSSTRGR